MRLPGTLKELSKQLAAFPARVLRVTVPTENGPFVIEFGEAKPEEAAAAPRARRASEPEKQDDGRRPENPKIRDTRLLGRRPPPFDFQYGPESEAA